MMIHSETEGTETHDVIAMCRSGHHAIIRWIAGHYSTTTFYNDCVERCNIERKDDKSDGAGIYQYNDDGSGDCIIRNYEDHRLENLTELQGIKILILRDPYNCFASRIRSGFFNDYFIETWIKHAMIFKSNNVYSISYNRWVIDEEYRKEISAELLKKPYSSNHLQLVSRFGCGSSFDDLKFDGRASEMNILNRWKKYSDNSEFKMISSNHEMRKLSDEIFGEIM